MNISCSAPLGGLHGIDDEPLPHVRISVQDDEDAERIECVLEALGYFVTRDDGDPGATSLQRVVVRLARRHHLNTREQATLALVLEGDDTARIAKEIGVSEATARWYELCLRAKTNTGDRESLLRLALFGRVARVNSKAGT